MLLGFPSDIRIDRNASEPLYRQIAASIRAQIRAGRLRPGVKLPATRTVAKELGLHRRTVIQAFELLMDEGWLLAGVGQGTFVRDDASRGDAQTTPREGGDGALASHRGANERDSFSWEAHLRHRADPSPVWRFLSRNRPDPEWIRFTGATADPSHFPAEDFRVELDAVFREQGAAALDYGAPEGILPLREWVRDRLSARGVSVDAEEIMIVNGSQQGLDLIARLLVVPGDDVLVEEPGYSNGFRVFQTNGARTLGVPVNDGGLDLAPLARILRESSPRLLYLMPNFQNPTGQCLDRDRVAPLLELCRRHNVPLIEDQFDGDLVYEGDAPRPLKSSDRDDQVVLLGSFSKILFPGLRLGWLVLPRPLLAPMRDLKQVADFSSGLLVQHAMERFCRRGLLDRHLERVRAIYGRRLRTMLDAMEREFPPEVAWTRPRGGLTLWATLPEGMDSLELLESARGEGVDFSPGFLFFPNGGGTRNLRLSYVRETEERIERGIKILARLIKEQLSSQPRSASGRPFF